LVLLQFYIILVLTRRKNTDDNFMFLLPYQSLSIIYHTTSTANDLHQFEIVTNKPIWHEFTYVGVWHI